MMKLTQHFSIFITIASVISFGKITQLANAAKAPDAQAAVIPMAVQSALNTYCITCHGEKKQKGKVRLDNFPSLQGDMRTDLLNKIQEALHFQEMPPEKAKQPNASQRKKLNDWVNSELAKSNASLLADKMRYPDYGNYVNHEKLFSGEIKDKAYTPARRWLVSPQIFIERVNAIFKLTGRGSKRRFYGVTNPIVLPDHSGVRYYDTTVLDGGHLLVMLNNAQWISQKQIFGAINKSGDRKKLQFENPKDRWYPTSAPVAFVAIIKKKAAPTDEEMIAAIHAQFDCVLQRQASEAELKRYLPLLRSTIDLGGNIEGLRQMLVSVILESEFLYRLEFGTDEVDKHGRRKLSPREASYAIAYALSDSVPDSRLNNSAKEGKLNTKEDYKREVLRILNDKTSFFAEGAPHVNSLHMRSHKVSHPKINRFFREFFGYPNSIKLFKDVSRSGGFYSNAGRGNTGTAGWVTDEADQIVNYFIERDQNVFEELLTTEKFFVLHRGGDEANKKIVTKWLKVYDQFKDSDWATDPKQFIADNFEKHKELFKNIRITKIDGGNNVREFKRYMDYFEQSFGRNITPFIVPWFYHGGQNFRYSQIYSLPKTPGSGPIGGNGKYTDELYWDYPLEQPFKIANRKGILTHPAWLLAHSQNTETDPVRRGRWIREKLLAGRVPDVPITVDAQIPEDHHRTLRERLDSVTGKEECWKCHKHMNPLGLTFENFDDFGRWRTKEQLEHADNLIKKGNGKTAANIYKTKAVNAVGSLEGTGDPKLDGEVKDAFDLIGRLAKSDRVRQSIIRHAFRYFMGRNEMLSDSQTLMDADKAYIESGGSFNAVIVSLLTSDSFIYRK
jgi:cytochrome c553